MGAQCFTDVGEGKDPRDAFKKVTEQALYDYGHAGYTGTIAEKTEFVLIPQPNGFNHDAPFSERARQCAAYADALLDRCDKRVNDKWGPCGCIDMGQSDENPKLRKFLFFGWASS